ncbi:MAG: deoxyribose-phosphate aldolase [bacterium]
MDVAKVIDQTNIREDALDINIKETCYGAKKYGFRGVCVNPEWVSLAKESLKDTITKVVCLIDPPIGDSSTRDKIKACKKAKKDGADELDVVISVPDVKHGRWDKVLKELKEICAIAPTKIIIGSGYLTDAEIKKASEIVKEAGAICVKTATSKDPLENRELEEKARHLEIMRQAAPGLLIKASGNIKTYADLKQMVSAGADIIVTSSGSEIVEESKIAKT